MRARSLLIINGPNLNLLGSREPGKYGHETLADIEQRGHELATELGATLNWFQSNHEGEIVERIHQAATDQTEMIIINAGAYTHTSIAIRDALLGVALPAIEVHLSNIHARESFRHHSYLADIAIGSIIGLGAEGYQLAIRAAMYRLSTQ